MRSMRTDVAIGDVNWSTLKTLLPYLTEFKSRMLLAVACLVMAKLASVGLPFILKHMPLGMLIGRLLKRYFLI